MILHQLITKGYGIHDALVIDNTGVVRDREGLSKHLKKRCQQVLLTAPGKVMFQCGVRCSQKEPLIIYKQSFPQPPVPQMRDRACAGSNREKPGY